MKKLTIADVKTLLSDPDIPIREKLNALQPLAEPLRALVKAHVDACEAVEIDPNIIPPDYADLPYMQFVAEIPAHRRMERSRYKNPKSKRINPGTKPMTMEEQIAMVEDFEASGTTQQAYCYRIYISRSTLQRAIKARRKWLKTRG